MNGVHDPYAALRYADYRRLLAGSLLASIATQMQSVALGWELYQRTNSATALGLVGLIQFLPVILLFLPAGQAADHYSRKWLVIGAQGTMALASSGLMALSFYQGPIPLMYSCMLLVGISQAINSPARSSLLPQLVPVHVLNNAITWNSSGWQVASMAGPALGGLVIAATGGATTAYLLAALCSLTVCGLLISVRPRREAAPPRREDALREAKSLGTVLAGIHFVWDTKLILATITLDLFAVLLGGATALLPIFARDILGVGPSGLGWLRAAPSIGAFLMAVTMAHRPPLQQAGKSLLAAVAGFGLATIVFGLSTGFWLSMAMLFVTGALDNISMVVRGTLVQVLTPAAKRGRVSAVNAIFIGSSNELGAFESGITAEWFGPVASVVGGGVGTLIVVVLVAIIWPQVWRLGSLYKAGQDVRALEEGIKSD